MDIKQIVLDRIGFALAVIVGLLFIAFFPLVGFCFCCCRCCGKCGGKKVQEFKANPDMYRRKFAVMLFVSAILLGTGTACMFASNFRLRKSVHETQNILQNSFDNIRIYANNIYKEVNFLGNETGGFLLTVLERDMKNLDVLVGIKLRNRLDASANITSIFDMVRDFAKSLPNLQSDAHNVSNTVEELKTATANLSTALTNLEQEISANCTVNCTIDTSSLRTDFNTSSLPDLNSSIDKLDDVVQRGVGNLVDKPEQDFKNIPQLVLNKSRSKADEVQDKIDNFTATLDKYLNMAKDINQDLDKGKIQGMDIKKYIDTYNRYLKEGGPYENYRSYVCIALACVCLLIALFQLVGIALGVMGYTEGIKPTERSSASECGGIFLMASVGFMFLFGALLMLLTTLMYIPGSVIERYGCSLYREIDTGSLDKVLDIATGDPNFIAQKLYKNASINVGIGDIYRNCKNGQGAYSAVHVDYIYDQKKITDFPTEMKIKEQIENITVDLSSIKIMTPDLEKRLNKLKDSLNINFTKFENELNRPPTNKSMTKFAKELRDEGNRTGIPSMKTLLDDWAVTATKIGDNEVEDVKEKQEDLKNGLKRLKTSAESTKIKIDKLMSQMNESQKVIQRDGNNIVKEELGNLADRIIRIWKDFTTYLFDLLNGDMLPCKPIVSMFDYLVIGVVCGAVDSFNGFWFGLGWCLFFFIPSIVLSVKLAKYYRRMKYSEEMDGSAVVDASDGGGTKNADHVIPMTQIANNKVGHM